MKVPVPAKPDATVILETYSRNELPFKFSDVQISINGPDIVVKTNDGHTLTFPFAAQFATMGKQVFTLVFADGKSIPSDQLLTYVTTVNVAPNIAAPVAHHEEARGNADKESSREAPKEGSKDATKEEIVVVETPPQDPATGGEATDAAHKAAPVVHPGDISKHRFDDELVPRVDHISGLPPKPENPPVKVEPVPVEPTPDDPAPQEPTPEDPTPAPADPTPTPADPAPTPEDPAPLEPAPPAPPEPAPPAPSDPTPPAPTPPDPTPPDPTPPDPTPPAPADPPTLKDIVLLKTQGVADASTHEYFLGGGIDAARTDGRVSVQYATREVDLSQETDGWTIHAESSAGVVEPGSMMRIVNVGTANTLLDASVSADLAAKGVSVVLWNSDEGIALGLKSNEFALHYPTANDVLTAAFTVHVDYQDTTTGENGSSDVSFQVVDTPTALRTETDVYQLSRHENDVSIHAGAGDDTIIAGRSNGVYDGGAGVNTLDYSGFASTMIVDLSADVRSALGIAPTGPITVDMGRVKTGDTVHSIENIQIIKGGDGDTTFIGNDFDHQFIGGAGNDTFIANGGNNIYAGGGGQNQIDYSRAGGTAFDTAALGASGRTLVLDGVDIDMSQGVTSNNGWTDVNGNAGTDHFSDVNQITGSAHNDRIRGSAGDDIINGGSGNNLIIGSGGNDKIDGGTGYNTISYAEMTGAVDVDLNGVKGSAVKADGGVDTLTHIQSVIGSAGGGTLTGLVGSNNVLVGTDGNTHFITNAGINQLYGGAGVNTYDLVQGTNTVYGGANTNIANFVGGANNFYAGDGANTVASDGGSTIFHGGAGTDTFTATGGGSNTMLGGSGDSEFHATGGGSNTVTAGSGAMHVFSGGANNTVTGGQGGKVTIDYTAYQGDGHLEISLSRNLSLVGTDFVDRLFNIDVIVGNKGGNSIISGGNRGIEIHVSGDNNTLAGGVGNNIFDGGSGQNNTVDYSGAKGAVNVNLNAGLATKNGSGFVDTLSNIQRIVGSTASGNVYEGKDGVNNWIDLNTGTNGRVYGSVGDDTYTSGSATNTIDYSKLSAAITLNTATGVVSKGVNGKDQLVNLFGTVVGSNHGDVITVTGPVNIQAGSGNDKIILTGPASPTTIDGGGGRNELDTTNLTSSGGSLIAYMIGSDGRSGTISGMSGADAVAGTVSSPAGSTAIFKNIDVLDTSNSVSNLVQWGTASHMTVNGSNNQDFLYVNGGGNHIDGRYMGSGETIASQSASRTLVSYNKTFTGVTANLETGLVTFADGRDSDSVVNISRFTGSAGNDVITGHATRNDWINASAGDDTINANGGSANVYGVLNSTFSVHADFDTGLIAKTVINGPAAGTDTVSHFQQYYGGSFNDWVHGKDGVDMIFNMGSGGTNTLMASRANNTIDGGGGNSTVNYSAMNAPVSVDLSNGKTYKNDSGTTDTFKNVFKVTGTTGDDVFTFNSQSDVTKLYLDGAGGQDVLQKSGTNAGTYDLTTMIAKVVNIPKIDFSTSTAADKVTVDFTNLLTRGNETLTLTTGAKDTITMTHNTALDGWTHTTTVANGHTTDTYALGGHQLIWNH